MSTVQENAIDFNRVMHNKVRLLLQQNKIYTLTDLQNLKSLCYNPADGLHYHKHFKSFLIHADIQTVWNTYKTVNPQETRNGDMVSFGFLFSRSENEIMYPGDPYTGMKAGQLVFLNLNLLGLVQLAVGHEIVEVNDAEKKIKICYLQNGASTGTQLIQLNQKENATEVTHETWYRSGSWFRDKILYPGFHEKGLTEFHETVKQKAERANTQVA